ncbi:hypothetical protein DRO54_02720 [Candidatus Bathyarchaeota archaeon]|nr:MAG: hypothetical protein DRO54_02720 [Candidatus Bathyarchaeota archaeon]
MKAKIALATVSGKAYYLLVSELKKRKIDFLSLTPYEKIPVDVKVVITTPKERELISHGNVLIFREDADPAEIVEEAERIVEGKKSYEKLVIGIDPGKNFGVAVLGDGKVIEALNCSNVYETVNIVKNIIEREPAERVYVKVGDGPPEYTESLLELLDKALSEEIIIERVPEAGTSRYSIEEKHRRGIRDVMSAIKIAGRNGHVMKRGRQE